MKTWYRGRNSGCDGFGVFDKAVSLWFDIGFEEHGLTEDGKTLAPFFTDFFIKSTSSPVIQTVQLDVVSSDRNCPIFPFELCQLGQLDHCNQLRNHTKSLQKRELGQLCQLGQTFGTVCHLFFYEKSFDGAKAPGIGIARLAWLLEAETSNRC